MSTDACELTQKKERRERKNAQGCGNKADQITNDAPAKRKNHGIARTSIEKEKILDRCLAVAALRGLAWRDRVR